MQFPDTITSPRLVLRPLYQDRPENLHGLIMASKPELEAFFPWARKHTRLEDAVSVFEFFTSVWQDRSCFTYAIYLQDTLIGVIEWRAHESWWGDIGYWTGTPYAGKGYMTEAVKAITAEAFRLGADRAVIRCRPHNPASTKVAEKAGYIYEGLLRQDTREDDGTYTDSLQYSRLSTD